MFQGGKTKKVEDNMVANVERRTVNLQEPSVIQRNLENVMARKRMGGVLLYTKGALVLAVFCAFLFNSMGQDTQFAIAIMGSLIGGFLGALLAAALIVDIYSKREDRDRV